MDPWYLTVTQHVLRLPRARGDGPMMTERRDRSRAASPRSRGWTRSDGAARGAGPGFPALAGMDPSATSRSSAPTRLPRARGDGPRGLLVERTYAVASPRSRGWTRQQRRGRLADAGFPALAGMDPCRRRSPRRAPGLPRARGDGPGGEMAVLALSMASPRSRGWTHLPALRGNGKMKRDPRGHVKRDPLSSWETAIAWRRSQGRDTVVSSSEPGGRRGDQDVPVGRDPPHASGGRRSAAAAPPRRPWLPRARGDEPVQFKGAYWSVT